MNNMPECFQFAERKQINRRLYSECYTIAYTPVMIRRKKEKKEQTRRFDSIVVNRLETNKAPRLNNNKTGERRHGGSLRSD